MAVTIKVNGTNLSLVHKGSMGIAKSTLPDVCKTPSHGVPVPYPVIVSMSADLNLGTRTVRVDGGNPAAIKGSQLSRCTGDEPGTLGGVKSSTNMMEATWLSYSFDVKMDGANACRLSDKMMMNHGNTVCLAGILQPPIIAAHPSSVAELEILCNMMCKEVNKKGRKQDRIARKLWALDDASGGRSTMKAEVPYDVKSREPYMSKNNPSRASRWLLRRGSRRPDVIVTEGGKPPYMENIKTVVEMKFKDGETTFTRDQLKAYRKLFGRKKVAVLEEGKSCICTNKKKRRRRRNRARKKVQQRQTAPQSNVNLLQAAAAVGLGIATVGLGIATVAAALCPADGPLGEAAAGTATLATGRAAAAAWGAAFAGGAL